MRRTWLVFSQAVTIGVALLFVVLTFKPEWLPGGRLLPTSPTLTLIQAASPANPAAGVFGGASGFALAARLASPAVVSITATRVARRNPHTDDPRFKFFFGDQPQGQTQVGLGSGVIVSPEGYLLTNHHVVEDATDIEVQLADGRNTRATVVGSDPETDIAVLKIDLQNLPVVTLGDVRRVLERVG